MRHCLYLITFLILIAGNSTGQLKEYAASKEKVYIHFNHNFFMPGDLVYFKAYITRGSDLRPSLQASAVYVDWYGPDGKKMKEQRFRVKDGFAEGSFYFDGKAKGGIYKVKAYTKYMRNESDSTWFSKDITLQKVVAPRILLQLDFPQKGYGPGSEVMANFKVRSISDQPLASREVRYEVLVSGKPVNESTFVTDATGKATIRFRLPDSLHTTDVLLRIRMKHDQYTESISRSVPVVLNDIDLQFMPEGGSLITGIPSNIAFRAVDEHGKPADVQGEILDQNGTIAARFTALRFGMGQFGFTPEAGKRYTARIMAPAGITRQYPLPAASPNGISMRCWQDDRQVFVYLAANNGLPCRMSVHFREREVNSQIVQIKGGNEIASIPTHDLPAGIVRISLHSMQGTPLAERLVFVRHNRQMKIELKTAKDKYAPREKVELLIRTTGPDGKPLPANVSLAVVDDKLWTFADDRQNNLLSWLLFSSELIGKVEEPSFYFKDDEPQALPALDLVMLTHGYRYFAPIPSVMQSGKLEYSYYDDHGIAGMVIDKKGRRVKFPLRFPVYLYDTYQPGKVAYAMADTNGFFRFEGLSLHRYYTVVAAPGKDAENLVIRMMEKSEVAAWEAIAAADTANVRTVIVPPADTVASAPAAAPSTVPLSGDLSLSLERTQQLQEVVTLGYGVSQKKEMLTGAVHVVTTTTIGNGFAGQLQGKAPGILIQQAANPLTGSLLHMRGTASLAGNGQPQVYYNGMFSSMADLDFVAPEIMDAYAIRDNVSTTRYGARSANGVLFINNRYWRQRSFSLPLTKPANLVVWDNIYANEQFTYVTKFYEPRYSRGGVWEHDDFRETIYWKPDIFTDEKGEARISFHNSDAATTFRMVAEGIGYNGVPGRAEATYAAIPRLAINLVLPKELLSGDLTVLQLHMKNNGAQEVNAEFKIEVPSFLELQKNEYRETLLPGASKLVEIPVKVLQAGYGNVIVYLRHNIRLGHYTLPITARERGFPRSLSISGSQSATHTINPGSIVPGSMRYSLQVFQHADEQLQEGMTALLREPHGCFEQVSATAYPNALILRYLDETGNARDGVRRKAIRYLKDGYEKLIKYETTEGGFEWFGRSPADLRLTALGLMEFAEMQRYVDVDPKMMQRTRDYLLSHRNGNGGFRHSWNPEQNTSFTGASNTYIVYAMAEAGMGDSILKEYEASLRYALSAKSDYQTAMMALAAHKMGKTDDYLRLMKLLEQPAADNVSAFYSSGMSLDVEVSALRALAMCKLPEPPVAKIAREIAAIMKSRRSWGYGSTQATVMALKAFMAYSKLLKHPQADPLSADMDGAKMELPETKASLADGRHIFRIQYPGTAEGKTYLLEADWRSLTPESEGSSPIQFNTLLEQDTVSTGSTVRMKITLRNTAAKSQPMVIAKVGIPGGLELQPWQLKEWTERNQVAYYEIFDGYLVLYWREFTAGEQKVLYLDLKANFAGKYNAQAGCAGLYYTPEQRNWQAGTVITVLPAR
ncbi:alpha-2-macroglobulin family protein [Chitinophaga deserti]|uniref:alpha-2-macroglobulin family protein n=1 Tax=Chitinophaga deserti TaxID=2164099 RepID=UPI000D6CC809|nr:alpha-2-macroglobulin family protein [Chitinophaga deserti]